MVDWTKPIQVRWLDSGLTRTVEVLEGPDEEGDYRVRSDDGASLWFSPEGVPYSGAPCQVENVPEPATAPASPKRLWEERRTKHTVTKWILTNGELQDIIRDVLGAPGAEVQFDLVENASQTVTKLGGCVVTLKEKIT